jgi:hypothetical protein
LLERTTSFYKINYGYTTPCFHNKTKCISLSFINKSSVFIFFLFQDSLLSNDDVQTGDHVSTTSSLLQSAERLIAPLQTAGASVQEQPTGGFNSANPTFAVLKATAFQQALGHPMAYARVLMQVKNLKKKQNLFEYLFF